MKEEKKKKEELAFDGPSNATLRIMAALLTFNQPLYVFPPLRPVCPNNIIVSSPQRDILPNPHPSKKQKTKAQETHYTYFFLIKQQIVK